MAKSIRSIKNTLCADETLGQCSITARFLFVGLITQVDDYGRFRSHAALVRGQVFPYDDLTIEEVERLLHELADKGRILLYIVDGQRYGAIPKWSEHQRVDNASRSELPEPPASAANCGELRTPPESVGDPAEQSPGDAPDQNETDLSHTPGVGVNGQVTGHTPQAAANCGELPLDRRGGDRKGEEKTSGLAAAGGTDPAVSPHGDVSELEPEILPDQDFENWWQAYPPRDGKRLFKAKALVKWQKLKPDERAAAIAATANYAAARGGPGQVSPADPFRWLNERSWTDWAEPERPATRLDHRRPTGRVMPSAVVANRQRPPDPPSGGAS